MRRWGSLALACLALGLLGVERPDGLGDVVEVRHWSYPEFTRVVVEFNRPVESEVRHLSADPAHGKPERLYLDVEGIWVGKRYESPIDVRDGLLQRVRVGQNTLKRTRVVIDVDQYAHHRLMNLHQPDRLVVDVFGSRAEHPSAVPGGPRQGRLPAEWRPVQTVVLDAGHGGRDPGAIGVGGLREKDVTLRLTRAVGRRLQAQGFDVVFTRPDDRALDLVERTAIAEGAGGDVFVSIHVNAAPRRSVQGVETYYLDAHYERHSVNVAARENGIDVRQVNALQKTLAKLHMEELSPQSRRLATMVHEQIVNGLPRRRRPEDLGVKKGPFYVLFLSNMPSILVEVGFITHRDEARRLRDPEYLEALAEQIAQGLVDYRASHERVAMRTSP
jgi:N-acetylmuramoyl-L-alanine amidase